MNNAHQLVVFLIQDQRYGLHLSSVDRIVRSVEITPLPEAPSIVLGVINHHGRIVPVINIRKRFNLPKREVGLNDQLIIAHTSKRCIALVVDSATEVVSYLPDSIVAAEQILPGMEYIQGVAKFPDGLILIHDLEKFLSLDEEQSLEVALSQIKTRNA
jgi:purine-binding chemotaxis protein CheW